MDVSLTLIGVVPAQDAPALATMLSRIDGPPVTAHGAGAIAVLAEPAPRGGRLALIRRGRAGLLKGLHRLQRRLEVACQAGPFLPFDPSAAACASRNLTRLLDRSAAELADALRRDGRRQQWDVVLRWSPEAVLAAARDRLSGIADRKALAAAVAEVLREEREMRRLALRAALATRVLAIAPDAPADGDAETGATILIDSGGEAAIEAALAALPPAAQAGASCDLRGPLPPLSFSPLRVAELAPATVDAAWRALDLPERLDRAELTRRWRELAVTLHPDRAGAAADPARLDEAGRAYRLLRSLARSLPADGPIELAALRARTGPHVTIPAEAA